MMAAPINVELEAAKFLHKLIQDSTEEPVKLATKLHVILQHMKSSGKENSMPYQVISRAMETVINQHGLDIEVLKSSRLPWSGGPHVGDSPSSQYAGSAQMAGITKDSNTSLAENEMGKIDSQASNRPPVGPSGAGHNICQGSGSHLSSAGSKVHGGIPGISSPMHFNSSSYDNRGLASGKEAIDSENWKHEFVKGTSEKNVEGLFFSANRGEVANTNPSTGKSLERDGGISNTMANANKMVQCVDEDDAPDLELFEDLSVEVINSSTNGRGLQLAVKDDTINNGNDVISAGKSYTTATDLVKEGQMKKTKREHKKNEPSISYEDLKDYFGMKLEDAAEKLGVSRSTLKRLCRQNGVPQWPSHKRKKVNHPLSNQDPSSSNPPTDQAIQDGRIVTIKAEYGDDIIKFKLPFSSRMRDLEEEVGKRLKLENGTFKIKYVDGDGDRILIACDADLKDCIHFLTSSGITTTNMFVELGALS